MKNDFVLPRIAAARLFASERGARAFPATALRTRVGKVAASVTRWIPCFAPRRLLALLVAAGTLGCAAGDGQITSLSGGGNTFDPPAGDSGTGDGSSTSTSSSAADDAGESTSGSTTGGAATNDCCVPAATPGCETSTIETCVCAVRPACCEDAWSADCIDVVVNGCGGVCVGNTGGGDTGGDDPPGGGDTSGGESSDGAPTMTCGELAFMGGFVVAACESNGNGACGGQGTPTVDCDFCCDLCAQGPTCGQLAGSMNWAAANCESNGNGACGGQGTPTCDCDFCCQVQ